ncbi:MAG: hypothetical protein M3137_00950 [Actinomycetota bacterium]|nr:hypothetical protein [Actinomycetota bacterium]
MTVRERSAAAEGAESAGGRRPTGPEDATVTLMESVERQAIVEGVADLVVTLAEVGVTERDALRQIVVNLTQLGALEVAVLRDAATAVGKLPQPREETTEETERRRPINERFGVPPAEENLLAALQGREWLELLAGHLTD